MIHVVAIITAKPGKRDEVLAHFRANMPAVHAEAGCIEYGPAVDAEGGPGAKYGADTFVVIEKWESLDHLKAHAASPHMQAYGAKTRELLANREIHVLSPAVVDHLQTDAFAGRQKTPELIPAAAGRLNLPPCSAVASA